MVELHQRRARAYGIDVSWVEAGSGPPLVLLHGLGDSHRTWLRIIPRLSEHFRVYALDLPGHGLSDRPDASYELAWHTRVVGAWIDYLELDGIHLIGQSYGGGVGQFLLLSHAERIRRLALVSSGGLGRAVHPALRLLAIPFAPHWIQPLMRVGTRLGYRLVGGRHVAAAERRWLSLANGVPGSARDFARTIRGVIGVTGQTVHFLDHAHRITALPPIRLFWGGRDPVLPAAHGEAAVRTVFDNVRMVRLADAGHFPHVSHPTWFVTELLEFLGSRGGAPARARWLPTG